MALNYRQILPELRSKKVGLVLCGGGFKGAYQIGVWKALTDPRIGITKFHSIAGTSAGALNAVLVANDDIQDAEKVWGRKDLLPLSVKAVGSYGLGYLLFISPFVAMAVTLGVSFSIMGRDKASLIFGSRFGPESLLALSLLGFPLAIWLLLSLTTSEVNLGHSARTISAHARALAREDR